SADRRNRPGTDLAAAAAARTILRVRRKGLSGTAGHSARGASTANYDRGHKRHSGGRPRSVTGGTFPARAVAGVGLRGPVDRVHRVGRTAASLPVCNTDFARNTRGVLARFLCKWPAG